MSPEARWKAISFGIVFSSLAAFGFFVYSGSTLIPTECGTAPCTSSIFRGATKNVNTLTDYVFGVSALLIGQILLALVWFVRRRRT